MHKYLKEIRRRFPDIIAYEEDDFEWQNFALIALEENDTATAEKLYMMITLSQPHQQEGFLGLARIYAKTDLPRARFFYDIAVEKSQEAADEGSLDLEVLEEIIAERDALPSP